MSPFKQPHSVPEDIGARQPETESAAVLAFMGDHPYLEEFFDSPVKVGMEKVWYRWFKRREEAEQQARAIRSAFTSGNVMTNVLPDADQMRFGEQLDVKRRTVAAMEVEWLDGRVFTYDLDFGYGFSINLALHTVLKTGACDCTRSRQLVHYCPGQGLDLLSCGNLLELLSLKMQFISVDGKRETVYQRRE